MNSFQSADYVNDGPAALGNFIAQQVMAYGANDGSNEANDHTNQHYEPLNPDLFIESVPGNPWLVQPNHWQSVSTSVRLSAKAASSNRNPTVSLSPEWGNVTPFGLPDSTKSLHFAPDGWPYPVWIDQGAPPLVDLNYAQGIDDPYTWGHSMVLRWSEHLDPSDGVTMDISPASVGNVDESLFDLDYNEYDQFYDWNEGGDPSQGWDVNPATGQAYEPQVVPRGDYARVLAEFWADGPDSETPPGHWFSILNGVMDHPDFEGRWMERAPPCIPSTTTSAPTSPWVGPCTTRPLPRGATKAGTTTSALSRPFAGCKDVDSAPTRRSPTTTSPDFPWLTASAKWSRRRPRLPQPGRRRQAQGSRLDGPRLHRQPRHRRSGRGLDPCRELVAIPKPLVCDASFAGYVEKRTLDVLTRRGGILAAITGDPFFPGGMGEFTATANEFLVFEEGPSQDVVLQWGHLPGRV